ncbi:hypothetical protein [Brachybacterium tyrofermentans]|uniref:hypothetical protein n=1 Tax=Brachybacterium tyrofermentans TaxID=47848 RepID=UPI003FD3079B
MSDIAITITPDASGTITIGDTTVPVTGQSIEHARQAAMQQALTHARETAQTHPVTANDPTGTFYLTVTPDGGILTRPAPNTPAWEQESAPLGVPSADQAHRGDHHELPGAPENTAPGLEAARPAPATQPAPTDIRQPVPSPTVANEQPPPTAPLNEAANASPIEELEEALEATPGAGPMTDPVESDPRWTEIAQQPATQGYRGRLNGWGLKLAPLEDEISQRREALRQTIADEEHDRLAQEEKARTEAVQEGRRAAREREAAAKNKAERSAIQTNYGAPKTASAMNDKGGVGKTTDILCIADAFGRIRGGDVVTWDANETRGTMGFRAQKDHHDRNVVDFLDEAANAFTTVEGSKRSTLTRYTRQQGDSKFSVLASHESRESQDQVDADAFRTVHEILSRFYSLILVDTGNNHTADHFQAALASTDQLIIPVSPGQDGAYAAELMLDNFIGQGYGHLVKNAIVLLHDSATRHGDAREIAAKFENRVRTILPIPFDPLLDAGGEIDFDALQPATRAAYQTAAAAVAQGLAETDQKGS